MKYVFLQAASIPGTPNGEAPVQHGNYDKGDSDEEEVMVKTEFVWADGADDDVKLSGAWNGWMPIQMYHEGGGMWSVVTPVPAGTHEFKFVVDGDWRHSTRHPTVGDNDLTMNNIRVIRGPPKAKDEADKKSPTGAGSPRAEEVKKGCCSVV